MTDRETGKKSIDGLILHFFRDDIGGILITDQIGAVLYEDQKTAFIQREKRTKDMGIYPLCGNERQPD